jgi:hypothetical protein
LWFIPRGLGDYSPTYIDQKEGIQLKKKYFLTVGMLALVLVFGMTVIGCPDPTNKGGDPIDTALNGTWLAGDVKLILENGSFEYKNDDVPAFKGTYTAKDGNLTMKMTQIYFDAEDAEDMGLSGAGYRTESQLKTAFRTMLRAMIEADLEEEGEDPADYEAQITEWIDENFDEYWDDMFFAQFFAQQTGAYTISGSTLTITLDGEEPEIYTKQ